MMGNREIDRYEQTSCLEESLGIDTTWDTFYMAGSLPSRIDMLNMVAIDKERESAKDLSIQAEIPSGPDAQ